MARRIPPKLLRLWREWILPVLLMACAMKVKLLLDPWMGTDEPYLVLFAAVTIAAYFGDITGGIVASVLALLVAALLTEPRFTLLIAKRSDRIQTLAFFIEEFVVIALCVALRRARNRAEAAAEETRVLQRQVLENIENEQRRIGQDLHDDLGQYLTAIALSGEVLARKLERSATPEAAEACRSLVHMVNDGVNRTRQLARGMSPMALDPDSLPLLLAELQERSAEVGKQRVTFDMTGTTPDLPHETILHLYRIAQEAVGNAMKHSRASLIEISLNCAENSLILSVRDDGSGVAQPRSDGMGMRVMAFRARSIGGRLDVGPRQDGPGTAVVCSLETNKGEEPT